MRILLVLSAAVPLTACASTGDRFPSLAIRDVERAQGRFDPSPTAPLAVPEVLVPSSAPLPERLAALGAQAQAAHSAFLASSGSAKRLANAAAGSAIGTPAWAAAQVALADLDSARSRTAIALADLDTLMVASAVQAQSLEAIEEVRQRVISQVEAEDLTLAQLRARVR